MYLGKDKGLWSRVVDARHGASKEDWIGGQWRGWNVGNWVGDKAEWWCLDKAIFLGGDMAEMGTMV